MVPVVRFIFFFFNDTATTEIYTLSLHDALPIYEYSIRRDGTVVIQKSVRPFEYQDEQKFTEFMAEIGRAHV